MSLWVFEVQGFSMESEPVPARYLASQGMSAHRVTRHRRDVHTACARLKFTGRNG